MSRKMQRRHFFAAIASAICAMIALAGTAQASAPTHPREPKPSILLVHGAFADGSSWDRVIGRLQRDGYDAVASQIPLTSFADDVAAVQRDLRGLAGPTVVVGHSYGGAVVTQAAAGASNVKAVVYIAAAAPDSGEAAGDFNRLAPTLPSVADFTPIDLPHVGQSNAPFVILARDKFRYDFCQDCAASEAALLAATEMPINGSAFTIPISGVPAWRQVPAWYQISTRDRLINPAAQTVMAKRMDPSGTRTLRLSSSHASLISHARQVTRFIERAGG
jgi:pimeloyl-ACP methyl ester carboxylesterase